MVGNKVLKNGVTPDDLTQGAVSGGGCQERLGGRCEPLQKVLGEVPLVVWVG